MSEADRRRRTRAADQLCARAFRATMTGDRAGSGVALVAVGGYGRAELAPYSDLDVVLVHDDAVDVTDVAAEVWYPLWDAGADLDHAVRSLSEAAHASSGDLRVALGLLDARHLAGDAHLTLRLRTALLAQWRREARARLDELRALRARGQHRTGELAHAAVPDLKESLGGLRDATALKALVATWLVDVPHTDLERCRGSLLDVRDVLHQVAGRRTDRVAPEHWAELAPLLALPDDVAAQQHVRGLGRRMTHLARFTWHQVDGVVRRPGGPAPRSPRLRRISPGLALSGDELVLDGTLRPDQDPTLLLRAGAEAAEREVILAPATAARLSRESVPLPDPWPPLARELFIRLLAAGDGLLAVWETLDETGSLSHVLPEWEAVRLLPHASPVHRFTVDRHLVETAIEASRLIRRVDRPDVLLVAALLHDVGKGGDLPHSEAGEPVARRLAARMGFPLRATGLVATLVRHHLLLAETATRRDLEDPATVAHVARRVGDVETLDLLAVLTEADARATSAQAWTSWRAGLVRELVSRVRALLERDVLPPGDGLQREIRLPPELLDQPDRAWVLVERDDPETRLTLAARDRPGLLADAAATLALLRVSVRAARAWTQDAAGTRYGVTVWDLDRGDLDPALVRQTLGTVAHEEAATRLARPAPARLAPVVRVRADLSVDATGLEVRMADRPGVVHLVAAALTEVGVVVRSAHVTTVGPQALDTFYLQELDGGPLGTLRAEQARDAVGHALRATVA